MLNTEKIQEGATITMSLTVVKKNKKSLVVRDAKGNTMNVRDRDFKHFSMGTMPKTKKASRKDSTSSKPKATVVRASGRMPNWATSNDKKKFVIMSRQSGHKATQAGYREYKNSKK